MLSIILIVSFFALLAFNVPVMVSLGLSSVVALFVGGFSFDAISSTMSASISKFVLLAIPFFILAGNAMEKVGISEKLIRLATSLVGHRRGGMVIVCLIVCCFFAALSGSGPATVAALGMIVIPAMVNLGYRNSFAAALLAAGGTIGIIIPPSIPFVIYGSMTNASIGDLFKSGIVPGLLLGMLLTIVALFMTRNQDFDSLPKASWKERFEAFKDAFWSLLMPVVILGGIYGGIFTPTEAAAVAAGYGLFVGLFIYRTLTWKVFTQILTDSALQTGVVMMIISTASLFAYVLTIDGTIRMLSGGVSEFASGSTFKFFILFNVVLLIVGIVLEAVAAMYIVLPIFFPVAMQLGIDPIHLGCVMIINIGLGQITPPVAVNLFVACSISKITMQEIVKESIPFLLALIVGLLLVTYIPSIALCLV